MYFPLCPYGSQGRLALVLVRQLAEDPSLEPRQLCSYPGDCLASQGTL